jgi:phosphohistidine phosphatase
MKTLLILRHAKSSWNNSQMTDHDRPLDSQGQRDAPRIGQLLQQEQLTPDCIISSSAERALSTAEQVALSSGFGDVIEVRRDFYLAAPEAYVARLQQLDDGLQRAMVVGHNPGLEELLHGLTGAEKRLPSGGLAQVRLAIGSWSRLALDGKGELVAFWRAWELG